MDILLIAIGVIFSFAAACFDAEETGGINILLMAMGLACVAAGVVEKSYEAFENKAVKQGVAERVQVVDQFGRSSLEFKWKTIDEENKQTD